MLHVARSSERDGSTSTETQRESVVKLLKPPIICYTAHYSHIPALVYTNGEMRFDDIIDTILQMRKKFSYHYLSFY